MKTRKEFIKNCCYPKLPPNTCSIRRFYSTKTHKQKWLWLGGRLKKDRSTNCFLLTAQSVQIKCTVSPDCHLSFDFTGNKNNHSPQKKILWENAFSLLRDGDCMVINIQKAHILNSREIQEIGQIVLISVCTTQILESSGTEKQQSDWFDFLSWIQMAMQQIGLFPVKTPSLLNTVGSEPELDVFETNLNLKNGVQKMFLPTSPEIYMKRLLCRGWTDIFEIKKCFRNNESGIFNSCEFYLLEWYRAYSPLENLIEDLSYLIQFLSQKFQYSGSVVLKKTSMKYLFKKHVKMDLKPDSSKQDFINQLKKLSVPFNTSQSISDLFYLLFLNRIEPFIDKDIPLIIYDYPPFQKAYAKINEKGWVSRFEFFWKGMELANAFDEVVKPEEQERRFREEHQKRSRKLPIPKELLKDMKGGMPLSSGIALGLDRLFMAFTKLKRIQQLQCFLD